MNLRHLQTFVAVADAGGLRRAAGRVNLSQPAISRQVHALEARSEEHTSELQSP